TAMNKLMLRGLFAAALTFGTLSLTACPAPYTLPTTAGAELKEDFWQSYFPDFKQDMSWTYKMTVTTGAGTGEGEMTMKVTALKDGVATVVTTGKVGETAITESTTTMSKKGPSGASSGAKYEKTETITVPAGEFKDAVKTSYADSGATSYMWIAKGVGIVKITTGGDATTSTELKSKSF
ncbi:MAG TPA: hypothetical protein V6D00_04525, partial [Pantanalinema sp.]